MKRLLLLTVSVTALLSYLPKAHADRTSDSLSLVALYDATQGESWFNSWDLADSIDTWQGVTLDGSGNVVALNLDDRNLMGTLPNLNLPELTQLVLSNNDLRESLPDFLGMGKLGFLDLTENRLSGAIPNFDLPFLKTLRLSENRFSGDIPNFSGLPLLETMVIEDNELSGGLPNFTGMPNLRSIRLKNNELEGMIPDLNFVPDLIILDLTNNNFIGGVPIFGASTTLFELRLSGNDLSGFVPRFTRTPLLDVVLLDNNKLVGPITTIGNLDFIRELDLSNNLLEGSIDFIQRHPTLERLRLGNNDFSGAIPSLDGFDALQVLDVSQNGFVDSFPDISALPALMEIYVNDNLITSFNFDASTVVNLRTLHVHNNDLTFGPLLDLNGIGIVDYIYAPQNVIPMPDTIFAMITDDVLIELPVDRGVPNNTYSWMFDGEFLTATASNELLLLRINALNVGTYSCTVNNNFLPALALRSEEVFLYMGCPVNEIVIIDTICTGDTLIVNDKPYFETGEYRDSLVVDDPGTCDSVFVITLTVNETFDTMMVDTVCASEGFAIGDTIFATTGIHSRTLTASNGCDSVVTVDLTVFPVSTNVVNREICAGDTLFVGNFSHTATGVYLDTLESINGCDSVIITDLEVIDSFLSVVTAATCFGETYTYRGVEYTQSGTYVEQFVNAAGCDSTYVLQLTIPGTDTHEFDLVLCSNDSLTLGDSVYHEAGTYTNTLITADGCDSIVIINLTFVDFFEQEFDLVMCLGDTLVFGGDTITFAGVYVDSLTSVAGCDSIVKILLNVVEFVPGTIDTLLCHDQVLVVGSNTYSESGIYRDTLPGAGGQCDTIVVSRVSMLDQVTLDSVWLRLIASTNVGEIVPSISGGSGLFRYAWNTGDTTLNLSGVPAGTYILTVFDDEGCDEVFEFVLDATTSSIAETPLSANVFPNPQRAGEKISLTLAPGAYQVDWYDVMGRHTARQILQALSRSVAIDTPTKPGLYQLRITSVTDASHWKTTPIVVH